ncbi:hypothetical protein GDO78_009151, partial [Eleutherodactylus coqui]
ESLEEIFDSPSPSSSLSNNALMMKQHAPISRRVSSVSESSTVSMDDDDDDDEEDGSSDEAPANKTEEK